MSRSYTSIAGSSCPQISYRFLRLESYMKMIYMTFSLKVQREIFQLDQHLISAQKW